MGNGSAMRATLSVTRSTVPGASGSVVEVVIKE
jgi:hypothetical protein